MQLRIFGKTDVGLVREHNEDALWYDAERGLAVVCDGMGGHASGERASKIAVDTAGKFLTARFDEQDGVLYRKDLRAALRTAHQAILADAEEDAARKGMGSTAVVVAFRKAFAAVAHLGDSRLYRWRDDALTQITTDHSWVRERAVEGLAKDDVGSNVITRALGQEGTIRPETRREQLKVGDIFLLCSDGLSGLVSDKQMVDILRLTHGNLENSVDTLIQAAKQGGGHDNITVLLASIDALDEADFEDDLPDENYPPDNTFESEVEERKLRRAARSPLLRLLIPVVAVILIGGAAFYWAWQRGAAKKKEFAAATNLYMQLQYDFDARRIELEAALGRRAPELEVIKKSLRAAGDALRQQDIAAAREQCAIAGSNLTVAVEKSVD